MKSLLFALLVTMATQSQAGYISHHYSCEASNTKVFYTIACMDGILGEAAAVVRVSNDQPGARATELARIPMVSRSANGNCVFKSADGVVVYDHSRRAAKAQLVGEESPTILPCKDLRFDAH